MKPNHNISKETFLKRKNELMNLEDSFNSPEKFCLNYTKLVEEYVVASFKNNPGNFSVVATGSFSRRELAPFSDIDVMFIIPSDEENFEKEIHGIIAELWDNGIEISHTIRAAKDIDNFLSGDILSFTQFFGIRFLSGSEELFRKWEEKFKEILTDENRENLLILLMKDLEMKEEKYGASPKTLEPNVKHSAGGLRDIHFVQWIYMIGTGEHIEPYKEITQTDLFISLLKEKEYYSRRELDKVLNSYRFMLGLRNALHIITQSNSDRFGFELQEKLSKEIKIFKGDWQRLMHNYFIASTTNSRFLRSTVKQYISKEKEALPDMLAVELGDFKLKDGMLYCSDSCDISYESILKAVYFRGVYDARISPQVRTKLIDAVDELYWDEFNRKQVAPIFRDIFNLEGKVGTTLRSMNEIGLLGALIPEFNDLIGFIQPGVYHAYTADEHTLIAIENIEKLFREKNDLAKIFHSLEEKDLLFIAILLHDIGKPVDVAGHEIIGAEMAVSIMTRFGFTYEKIELVKFLVRHHLTMEQTALRRDLNDPYILNDFVSIFPDAKALEYLYLLTYADLSAVNPTVWTQWKSDLLFELYSKSKVMLENRMGAEDFLEKDKRELRKNVLHSGKKIAKHIEEIDNIGYLSTFSPEEIEVHVNAINRGEKVSVIFKQEESFTNVTVITRDFNSLLARLCGAFAINDVNIHDAKIFTKEGGIVIDNFNVTDFVTGNKVNEERFDAIKESISAAVRSELLIAKEFRLIRSRWKRLEKKLFKRKKSVEVRFIEHHNFTIIEVATTDRLGLLYKITDVLNKLGLDVYFAKIATMGEDVVDTFYTLERSGRHVKAEMHELIREEISMTINKFLEQ